MNGTTTPAATPINPPPNRQATTEIAIAKTPVTTLSIVNPTGELLTITGKREIAPEVEGEGYLVRERAIGKFVRPIRLPAPVADKKVQADYRDGMLVLHLPKETAAPATKILIK